MSADMKVYLTALKQIMITYRLQIYLTSIFFWQLILITLDTSFLVETIARRVAVPFASLSALPRQIKARICHFDETIPGIPKTTGPKALSSNFQVGPMIFGILLVRMSGDFWDFLVTFDKNVQ